jgi:hypothetical protein
MTVRKTGSIAHTWSIARIRLSNADRAIERGIQIDIHLARHRRHLDETHDNSENGGKDGDEAMFEIAISSQCPGKAGI